MEYKKQEYFNVVPGYSENPDLRPGRFYHTGFEEGLESIVLDEKPGQKQDEQAGLLSNKNKTLKATIKALFNEIMLREELDSFLIYRINKDICRQHSYFENVKGFFRFNYEPEIIKDLHEKKVKIENNVVGLEKEKRKEYLECWRDLISLKKDLLTTLKDYWLLSKRKYSLDTEDDGRGEYMQEIETYNWRAG